MTRTLSRLTLLAALALVIVPTLSGCDLTELNDNPNQPTEANPNYLFTNTQRLLAANYWGSFQLGRFTNLYAQYWSQTQYVNEGRYLFPIRRASVNSGMWNAYYQVLNALEEIVRIAQEEPERAALYGDPQDQIAMARIEQVWIFQTLTDIYGPIPLEEALQGRDDPKPAYTPQKEVYPALIDTLTKYAAQLSGEQALAAGDVLFGGDTGRWQAFANGLRMRMAVRMAGASEAAAKKAFNEAWRATSFTDLEGYQRVLFSFGSASTPYFNPIYGNQVAGGRDDWGVSKPLLSLMNELEDPRRGAYAQKSEEAGTYVGYPYGLTSGPANQLYGTNNFSRPSERVAYTATAPAILYTEAEELFMLAEAAEHGWISGSAEAYYNDAIRASMAYWGAGEAEAEAYLTRVPYDNANGWAPKGDQATWKQTLGIQKWVAFYMQGLQGWSVFRRLDFDGVLVVPPGNPGQTLFGQAFPVRLPYPIEEPSLNGENYTQAVTDFLGEADDQGTRLWWDVSLR